MNNAERAIREILKHEGGYVDHPRDPGGATNKGITIATFRRYIKRNGTKEDLRNLTTGQAVVVYKRQYWDAVMGDDLPSGVDYAVADFAVNSGPSRAIKYLQKVVGTPQDGRIGPKTLGRIKLMDPAKIINRLCDDRLAFMKRLKIWPTFKNGWSRRVSEVRALALRWAHEEAPTRPVQRPSEPSTGKAKPTGLAAFFAALAAVFRRKQT